jgi:hypothetical protein
VAFLWNLHFIFEVQKQRKHTHMKIKLTGFNITVELASYEAKRLLNGNGSNIEKAKLLEDAETVVKEAASAYAYARGQIDKLNKKFNTEE